MLDYAEKEYGRGFVSDVKALKNVCYIFLPLPIFWALFDQQVRLNVPIRISFNFMESKKNLNTFESFFYIRPISCNFMYHFRDPVGHSKPQE